MACRLTRRCDNEDDDPCSRVVGRRAARDWPGRNAKRDAQGVNPLGAVVEKKCASGNDEEIFSTRLVHATPQLRGIAHVR